MPLRMRYVGLSFCFGVAAVVFACGGSDSNGGGNKGTGGDGGDTTVEPRGGEAATETGGQGDTGGTAGKGNAGKGNTPPGGEGGETLIGVESHANPRTGYGNVVDGVVAHSKNFTMILSVGEEPGGSVSMGSATYRVNLGVVGSTQK